MQKIVKLSFPLLVVLLLSSCGSNNNLTDSTNTVQHIDAKVTEQNGKQLLSIHLMSNANNTIPLSKKASIKINGEEKALDFRNGKTTMDITGAEKLTYHLSYVDEQQTSEAFYRFSKTEGGYQSSSIPLWLSILPPLIAILMALIFREVIISLFAGIWFGALVLNGFSLRSLFSSFFEVIDTYIVKALTDSGHISVIAFSMLIGGMVAIISRNGGMLGVVNWLSRYAKSARSTQMITWLLGVGIFFDDYANTLIVGNTMRPVTDRFRISREKLAYIVDSTAAPIAAVAFITTWIGAELGYIEGAIANLNIDQSPYSLFLNSLAYSYYPVFTLFFIFCLIYFKKDYGTMYKAEYRARTTGRVYNVPKDNKDQEVDSSLKALDPVKGVTPKAINALLPIFTVIIVTIIGLIISSINGGWHWNADIGFFKNLSAMVGNSDSYVALLWSSLAGVTVASILSLLTKKFKIDHVIETLIDGMKTMLPAICILILAWSLAAITEDLYTANYLTSLIEGNINPFWFPAIVFLLAGVIAFSTGSSWGTMAILYPLVLPTTWTLCLASGYTEAESFPVLYNVISVVLAGSVFGDHCSPISDTTILSSLASNCHHIDHVRTQLPYAVSVAVVSILAGGLFFYLGMPWWLNYIIGFVLLFGVIRIFGKTVEDVV